MSKDLHELPKLRDSMSYIYVEHAIIEQDNLSIMVIKEDGKIPIPIASLTVLMIGPGTRITHAAIRAICDNGCMAVWCGERVERFYASGIGETRSASNLLKQAKLCMEDMLHMEVVRRMYERRFPDIPDKGMTLRQIRGLEGIRVKQAYKLASKTSGVPWTKRDYKKTQWEASDVINRALSAANACLYALCHAAIVSLGYSPGLGFVHTGKMLSFVYDIADLYKADTTIPAAFEAASKQSTNIERDVRIICRRYLKNHSILKRIPEDIDWIFQTDKVTEDINAENPSGIWDEEEVLAGGRNYSQDIEEEEL
jgi:CRISPR-associated protein Cas1